MQKFMKIAAVAAAASMLAACGGQSSVPDTSSAPAATHNSTGSGQSSVGSLFTRMTDTGTTVHYFPTRSDFGRAGSASRALSLHPGNPNNLVYGGGPIQPNPNVYVVFWGKLWNGKGDPKQVKPYLLSFLSGLNGSQWTSVLTQYYGPSGTFINNDTALAGQYVDTAHQPPLHPTDGQIQAEAAVAAAHFGDYSVNASYVVVMPHGHNPTAFGNQYCAYHSAQSQHGSLIAWTNLPYIPDAGPNCGAGSVNSPGTLDGVTIVEGHEQGETETDPQPTSGWDGPLGEIGDACAWQGLQNTSFSTGTFPTQPLWSNSAGGCVQ